MKIGYLWLRKMSTRERINTWMKKLAIKFISMQLSIRKRHIRFWKTSQGTLSVLNLRKLKSLREAHYENFIKSNHNTILRFSKRLINKFRPINDAHQKLHQKYCRVIVTLTPIWTNLLNWLRGSTIQVVTKVKVDQSQWTKHWICKNNRFKMIQKTNHHLLALCQQQSNQQ